MDQINFGASGKHRKSSVIIFLLGIVLIFLVILSLTVSLVLLIFPTKEIEVSGDSRYSYSEIIEASGVKIGSRLYFINGDRAEKVILEKMPYLENAKVNSYFPDRVKIEIKEFEDIYILKHESGFCYVNGDFEILEVASTLPDYENFSGIFIKLENAIGGEIGDTYNGEDMQRAIELISHIKKYGFYKYLDIVDVEQKYNVAFVFEKKYKFVLGSMSDMDEKIDASYKICFSDGFKMTENCTINSSDKKRVIVRYIDDAAIRAEFDFCEN